MLIHLINGDKYKRYSYGIYKDCGDRQLNFFRISISTMSFVGGFENNPHQIAGNVDMGRITMH